MYTNEFKINKDKFKNLFKIIICSFTILICASVFIGILLDDGQLGVEEPNIMLLTFFIFSIIPSIFLYKSLKIKSFLESISLYSRFFEGDIDGYIYISDMVDVVKKNEQVIIKELNFLLKKKYMTNFVLTTKRK